MKSDSLINFNLLKASLLELPINELVDEINYIRENLHEISPFKNEPVDFVKWIINENVVANDYNPNKVAPPEMELLELSIHNDGYTQPIVTWPTEGAVEVIDGYHRHRVGKESKIISKRVSGYLPTVIIKQEQSSKKDRMASTIRHNRARGKHQIDAMSEIVIELKNRNWANKRIAKELGMDEEEVLRLCQISGLEELFNDKDFTRAWEAGDEAGEFTPMNDDVDSLMDITKIPHENNGTRVFHTYDKWECHKAGFYASNVIGKTKKDCEEEYASFLSNCDEFREAANSVINEWIYSCEHYLTNFAMNRIAWIGQAAACYARGLPSKYCSGFNLMSDTEKDAANLVALDVLNDWLQMNGYDPVDMDAASSKGRQVEIY